jgi:hypothetical protein
LGVTGPEASIFNTVQTLPDPWAKRYLTVTETGSTETQRWNNIERTSHDTTISGKTVIFEAGSTQSVLYDSYSGRQDLTSMAIYLSLKVPTDFNEEAIFSDAEISVRPQVAIYNNFIRVIRAIRGQDFNERPVSISAGDA